MVGRSTIEVSLVEEAPQNNSHNKKVAGKEYNGVGGHLFAEAVRQSIEAGYGGCVAFMAKTNLFEYYEKNMYATRVGTSQRMFIEGEGALKLYEKYFGKI